MSTTFTIGGVDFSNYVDLLTVQTVDSAPAGGDTLTFDIVVSSSALDATPGQPYGGQIVSMSVDGVKYFEGVVVIFEQKVRQSRDNYVFSVKCIDYTYLLGSKLVTGKYPSGPAGELVKSLVAQHAPEFGTRYVRSGFPVPEDEYDHAVLTSVIDKYAHGIGFEWYVDFDRQIHFSEGDAQAGPVSSIDLDTDNRLGDVNVRMDVTQLRNRVYVKDAAVKSSEKRRDTYVADGNQSFFRLFSPPWDSEGAEVRVNENVVTVFEDSLTTQEGEILGGSNTEIAYFCTINQGLRFPLPPLPEGTFVSAEYYPEEGGGDSGIIVMVEDPDSIRMMRQYESTTGYVSDGVHETLTSVPEMRVTSLDPLAFVGALALDRGAWPEITGSFVTVDDELRGWKPGQSVTLSSAKRNLYSPRVLWREGRLDDIKVIVNRVERKFRPKRTESGEPAFLFEEKISFSSIPQRLST